MLLASSPACSCPTYGDTSVTRGRLRIRARQVGKCFTSFVIGLPRTILSSGLALWEVRLSNCLFAMNGLGGQGHTSLEPCARLRPYRGRAGSTAHLAS